MPGPLSSHRARFTSWPYIPCYLCPEDIQALKPHRRDVFVSLPALDTYSRLILAPIRRRCSRKAYCYARSDVFKTSSKEIISVILATRNSKTLTHIPCSFYPAQSKYYVGAKWEPYCSFKFSNNHIKISRILIAL